MDGGPARDVRLPPVPECHGRDVPRPGAGGRRSTPSTSTTPPCTIYAMVTPEVAEKLSANADDAAAGATEPAGGRRRRGQRDVGGRAARPARRRQHVRGVRQARKRDRPLPRHPRRPAGGDRDERLPAPRLRAARAGHDDHHQSARAHECHWPADTSGARRRVGPVPRRRRRIGRRPHRRGRCGRSAQAAI